MNSNTNPKLSIITVVFNAKDDLEKTIQSVINQNYPHIEYIIIDGGSNDGSVEVIKKYEDKIGYYKSEPDNGIYDAMNKGIKKATGDGLLFLNAGDYFVGQVITTDIQVPCFLPVKYNDFFGKFKDIKIKSHKSGLPNNHQGIIFENKNIFYDTSYKLCADYDFFLRYGYDDKLPMIKLDGDSYVFYDNDGVSNQNAKLRDDEIFEIINHYFSMFDAWKFWLKYNIKLIIKGLLNR
jgi:glycosyltransferase involved in cell wall biosynthesis